MSEPSSSSRTARSLICGEACCCGAPASKTAGGGAVHDHGIISQFEGYEKLRELVWEEYRARYGNNLCLDLILEQENDSANRYKLTKQADVLMLFYLFSSEELGELFERLGYPFEYLTIPRNVAYYADRSSHCSTLSRVVDAWVLARSGRQRSMDFFAEALQSDESDAQQGTTAEGINLGAITGTVDLVQLVSTGIEVRGDVLLLNPELPREMERLDVRIRYRRHSLDLRLNMDKLWNRTGAAKRRPTTSRTLKTYTWYNSRRRSTMAYLFSKKVPMNSEEAINSTVELDQIPTQKGEQHAYPNQYRS